MPQNITDQAEMFPPEAEFLAISEIRFEHLRDALGIGTTQPRLSWIVTTATPGWQQSGYAIEAYTVEGQLHARIGLIESGDSVLQSWPFAPLQSRERLNVGVQVKGRDGSTSAWPPKFVQPFKTSTSHLTGA